MGRNPWVPASEKKMENPISYFVLVTYER
jgi:hypothetical protein